jgi:N-methylhydantoinase B/oxoprolinase/acetone carboxylase alpha subunit
MPKKHQKSAHDEEEQMQLELAESLEKIIPALVRSGISDDKKLFYLYLIADGSFSMKIMEDIQRDMEDFSKEQEAYISDKESEIADLEAKIAAIDTQLDEVAAQHSVDLKHDVDELVHLAAAHTEEAQKSQHKASIKQLKKRLSE